MRSVHDFQTNVSCCCNNILERIRESLEFCLCLQFGRKAEQASSTLGRRSFSFLTVFFFFFFNLITSFYILAYFRLPIPDTPLKCARTFTQFFWKLVGWWLLFDVILLPFCFCFVFFFCVSDSRSDGQGGAVDFPSQWGSVLFPTEMKFFFFVFFEVRFFRSFVVWPTFFPHLSFALMARTTHVEAPRVRLLHF